MVCGADLVQPRPLGIRQQHLPQRLESELRLDAEQAGSTVQGPADTRGHVTDMHSDSGGAGRVAVCEGRGADRTCPRRGGLRDWRPSRAGR